MTVKSKTVTPISPSRGGGRRLTPQNAGAAVALLTALYWVTNHQPKAHGSTALPSASAVPSLAQVRDPEPEGAGGPAPAGRLLLGMDAFRLQSLLLRFGLAFVFLYASVSAFVDPLRFVAYMPHGMPPALVERFCLPIFSTYEAILAACFLAGRRLFAASILATLTLVGIIVLNPDKFTVLFRNVGIIGAALAVAIQSWQARPAGERSAAPSTVPARGRLRRSRAGVAR